MSQTVYFDNPQTIVNNTNDINAIKTGLTTTLNTQNINATGTIVLNNVYVTSTITDFRSQVDTALINAELMVRPMDFRVVPHINANSTLWFTTSPTWTITSGYIGSASSGAIAIQYDTDMNFTWQGVNNNGSSCFFTGTFRIPSLNTGAVNFNVYNSSNVVIATGSTGAQYGPIQNVVFKYKGQGQNASVPIQQGTQNVLVTLPPTWFTTGTHKLIISKNGAGETSFSAIEKLYNFPPYNTGAYPGQKDNRDKGQYALSTAYNLNNNISASNSGNYVTVSIPSDPSDTGINPWEESGEFDSFLREWIIAVGQKTLSKTYIHGLSVGGSQLSGDYYENYYWQGIRFTIDGITFVATSLSLSARGLEVTNRTDKFNRFPKPDPQNWSPALPKTSYLCIIGANDEFFSTPTLAGGLTAYYSVPTTAKFLRDKLAMNEINMSTGAIFSNTGVYANLPTSATGNYYIEQVNPIPYTFTNPQKFGGSADYAPTVYNIEPILSPEAFDDVYFPTNPCYVYSLVVPVVRHPLPSVWSGLPTSDPAYGLDFMKVWIDFVNKTL
jgi:hypothetical protein